MTSFQVWAPAATQVDVLVGDDRRAMTSTTDGWWVLDAIDAAPGARYGFSVDGGPTRPDPRSRHEPDGVHGLSSVVDPTFPWTDGPWTGRPLLGSVLYELHIGTFTTAGTFDAAIDRLPHLVALGIDAVEVMPIAEFSGDRGWGYDGVNLYAPHHAYGGPDGFRRFVDACHGHGLGVILDVVYNHLGPSGNYLAEFGPYFTDRRSTNWGAAINVDGPDSDEVRRFLVDNALMWLDEFHCDGLRLDAVHAIEDSSAVHLLEQLATEVAAQAERRGRTAILVAESDRNDPRYVHDRNAGGHGLDAAWADEWHHALHAVLTGETNGYYEDFGTIDHLAKALRQAWVYDGVWSQHRRRTHGRSPARLVGHQFVISAQNHDQIGNRATGDRLGATVGLGRLRIAAALLLTAPFTPLLFQGEEWGASSPFQYFTAHEDPELGRAVTEGRRREFAYFGWNPEEIPDPQDPGTFHRSKLRWDERGQDPHAELLTWYRDLIALRRREPDLIDPRLERSSVTAEDGSAAIHLRRGHIHVLINLGSAPHQFVLDATADVLLAAPGIEVGSDGSVLVPADGVAVLGPPK